MLIEGFTIGIEFTNTLNSICFLIDIKILGMPRRRWEDNIRMDLEEIGRPYQCGELG